MQEGKQIRWGIIGAGNVCEHKGGPPLYRLKGSSLVLVHRRDKELGRSFVERHGHGSYVGSIEELVTSEAIDAVYVASPHTLHKEHTLRALEAGKHVMVEKPMAVATEECDIMIEEAHRRGCSLGVAYYRRGYPAVRKLAELLAGGVIGGIRTVAINNEFPTSHRLDLLHFLFGGISAARILPGNNDPYSFEATLDRIELQLTNGGIARMMPAWAESGMPEALHLTGESGQLHLLDLKKGALDLTRNRTTERIECGGLPYTHWGLFENFNRHLMEGEPLFCPGEEGRKSTRILDSLKSVGRSREWYPIQ
ncbi:MAG: Gfo/Idh/MocA family oxidoreductase [Oceanipulchritudo sp.]